MKILLVEDDEYTASAISNALTTQHYLVNTTDNGQTGLELVKVYDYDLILLDLIVPKLDGISFCRELRSQGYQMPILMLTAKDNVSDRIVGLEAGADDYVIKPFDISELVARIRVLLRRRQLTTLDQVLSWENLQLNLNTHEVTYRGTPLHLTPKEYGLLELFLRNPRRIFSRSAILDNVWQSNEFPGERAVNTQIKGLRQKLKAAGMSLDLLETVYGLGYRLKLAPEVLEEPSTEVLAAGKEPVSALSPAEAEVLLAVTKVWEKFRASLKDKLVLFEQAIANFACGTPNPDLQREATIEAHRLIGSLGSFGLPEGSEVARKIEQWLATETQLEHQEARQAFALIEQLRQIIDRRKQEKPDRQAIVSTDAATGQLLHLQTPLALPATEPILTRLLIVDDDVILAEQIKIAARAWNIEVEIRTTLASAREAMMQNSFDLILLDLSFPATLEDGLTFLSELANQSVSPPVMVMTGRNRLTDRVAVARLGGRAFLQKPISPNQLLQTVAQTLPSVRRDSNRVLVVDDDPTLLSVLTTLLNPWGLEIATLDDSQQFWEVLEAFVPNLLLLDVEMPHFSGPELCQAVRNDPRWGEIPVLFLTTQTDAEAVRQMFMVGADDYVMKPVVEPELVTRVLNRLERLQTQDTREQTKRQR